MAVRQTGNPYNAGIDSNNWPTLTAVSGTVGTADTAGTAEILAISGNPTTGALYVQDLSGASGTTTVQMVSGTLNVGTVTTTLTLNTGTITTIVAGTQNTLGTVGVLNNGTLALVSTVTTISNLTNGSINILTGTIQNSGTTTGVGVVSNLTNGSINLLTGTLTSLSNLAAGTMQINPDPVPTMLVLGTQGTAGGSFFATISAASGAGTKHFVSGVDIVVESGTADVRVLVGSTIQGAGVLAAGKFPAGGGISKIFTPAFETGTNSELIYHFVGAGTAFIHTSYWRGV